MLTINPELASFQAGGRSWGLKHGLQGWWIKIVVLTVPLHQGQVVHIPGWMGSRGGVCFKGKKKYLKNNEGTLENMDRMRGKKTGKEKTLLRKCEWRGANGPLPFLPTNQHWTAAAQLSRLSSLRTQMSGALSLSDCNSQGLKEVLASEHRNS